MSLAADIRALRTRTITDLVSAHDYYTETKEAWRLLRREIAAGRRLKVRYDVTGSVTTREELVERSRVYVVDELASSTFQQFLSIFEAFLFDFLGLWLAAYPQSLSGKKVDFRAVLELPDKQAIIRLVVGRELNEVLYERPSGWFDYLEERAKLGCPSPEEIGRIAEAKATRDVFVHNRGIANNSYLAKAGELARVAVGEFAELPGPYHRAVWDLLRKVVADIADAALAKLN